MEETMLNLIGHVVGLAAIFVNFIAIVTCFQLTLPQRLIAAAIAGAWVGLASGLAASGALAFSPGNPVPLVGVLFAIPLLTVAALSLTSATLRKALMAIPMSLLIGLNSLRILGFLFLALAAVGRLSGPFPWSAGLGDIITGVFAIFLARRVARGEQVSAAWWNAFGTLDLMLAVGLGMTTAQGSPLQIFHVGVGSAAMQALPFSLVPTVLVPFYLITHGIIAAQLVARRKAQVLATA
jgi:hypothetical protein